MPLGGLAGGRKAGCTLDRAGRTGLGLLARLHSEEPGREARTIGAEQPPITVPPPPRDRWPVVRRWLLGAFALFAIGLGVAGLLTGEPMFAIAAWTFVAMPIVYLVVAAARGAFARPAGVGIAAGLAIVVTATTVMALISCGQRLEPRADLAGCDLTDAEIAGLDLNSANLSDADLSGANLAGTNLASANLTGANLAGARFDETVLINADLQGADLSDTDLTRTLLPPASLEGAVLDGTNLQGIDLASVTLAGASARGATLRNANLSSADLSGVALEGASLDGATLIDTKGLGDDVLAQALGVGPDDLARTLAEQEIRLEDRQEILTALEAACAGRGVSGTTPYPQGAFHPMAILNERGQSGMETDRAAERGWEPMAVRFAQLVACLGDEEETQIESCPYSGEGKFATITRVQNHREFKVVEASTGRTVLQRELEGTMPKPCPFTHFFSDFNLNETFSGSSIGFSKIEPELARLVE